MLCNLIILTHTYVQHSCEPNCQVDFEDDHVVVLNVLAPIARYLVVWVGRGGRRVGDCKSESNTCSFQWRANFAELYLRECPIKSTTRRAELVWVCM